MERYSSRTIDELNRIVLNSDLRKRLGLEAGAKVSLKLVDTIVILQKFEDATEQDCFVCQISELGMIELPAELRQKLNWRSNDKLAPYSTDNLIILKLAA